MGQRGPQPRPGKIHKLHGSFRQDRHGGELKIKPSLPDPPEWLDAVALAEWNRLAPELYKLGVLTVLDTTLLAMYAVVYSRWIRAEAELLKDRESRPEVMTTPNGYQQQSAWLSISNNCVKQMQSLCAEFGLSPATRARIKLIESRPEQKSLLELLDQFGQSMAAGPGDKR